LIADYRDFTDFGFTGEIAEGAERRSRAFNHECPRHKVGLIFTKKSRPQRAQRTWSRRAATKREFEP